MVLLGSASSRSWCWWITWWISDLFSTFLCPLRVSNTCDKRLKPFNGFNRWVRHDDGGLCENCVGITPSPPWRRRSRLPSTPEVWTSPPGDRPRRCTRGGGESQGSAAGSPSPSESPAGGWAGWPHPPTGSKSSFIGGFLGTAPSHRLTQTRNHQAPAAAHLLVQSDVVDADALFSSEEVGAVVAVLQHSPAVRRPGGGMTRVARAPKSEQAAGGTQTLRAGVVIIQKAWRHRGEESNNGH